jgi:osmotically-inducible protein OsmY
MNRKVAGWILACASVFASGCLPLFVGGVATGVLVADDRRSTGTVVDDQNIELRLANTLGTDFGKVAHVNTTAYNRVVLLTGEATTEAVRAQIEKAARAASGVHHVQNEMQIAVPSTLSARSNDSFITGKVKARLVDMQARGGGTQVQANHVKVVTEAGVVYLMGLVTAQEADQASEIARTTSDVSRVVRVFEIIKTAPSPSPAPEKAAPAN